MYPNSPDFTTVPYMGSSAAQPAIWQYASDGDVDGANIPSSGHVDVNVRYMVPSVDSVSVTSSGGVKVSWKALSGAKSYTLYRRDNSTNKETVVKTGLTGTSYTDSSCPEGERCLLLSDGIHVTRNHQRGLYWQTGLCITHSGTDLGQKYIVGDYDQLESCF